MTDRLRVGMLAPVAWRVPPLHYGPSERVVSILTEGLAARGVDVTLFCDGRFGNTRALSLRGATWLLRRFFTRRQGVRMPAHRRGLRAGLGGCLRHLAQP